MVGLKAGWLAAGAALAWCGTAQAAPDTLCGRSGAIADLLLSLQKASVESLWRDKTLFVLRDHEDGSLWAFSIKNSTVHPAVRCRRPPRTGDGRQPGPAAETGPAPEIGQICTAGDKACASFATQADARFAAVAAATSAAGR